MIRLSASAITLFRECSLKWFFSEHIPLKPTPAMVLGGVVHSAVAAILECRRDAPDYIPSNTYILDAVHTAFDWAAHRAIWNTPIQQNAFLQEALDLTLLYASQRLMDTEPLLVEQWLQVQIGDVDLVGIVDLFDGSPVEAGVVADLKVMRKEPSPSTLPINLQLALYTMLIEDGRGLVVGDARLDVLVRKSGKKKPYLKTLILPKQHIDVLRALDTTMAVARQIREGAIYPIDDPDVCFRCSYRSICWGANWHAYLEAPATAIVEAQKEIPDLIAQEKIAFFDMTDDGGGE